MNDVTRRTFLCGAAAVGAAAVLGTARPGQVLRHGPIDLRYAWLFGPDVLKTTIVADHRRREFVAAVMIDQRVIRTLVPLTAVELAARWPGARALTSMECVTPLEGREVSVDIEIFTDRKDLVFRFLDKTSGRGRGDEARMLLSDVQRVL